jgi:photosystem II stability/assembly factor-like uncharacterized protein/outer membrane lipoprotein-sorting protein
MRTSFGGSIVLVCLVSLAPAQWQDQNSGVQVQLRGISAVSATVAWASGANGTVLRTVNGGRTWEKLNIDGAEKLDFRDIRAFDDKTAYVLSIGAGDNSRIYKTTDGGRHWKLQFTNQDPKAFYDCFAFWSPDHGIAVSDSVNGQFPLIATSYGSRWSAPGPLTIPPALDGEGAFAASGTCIATYGQEEVWFVTGAARVFHSSDRGKTWTVSQTPILSGTPSQGIFSVVFRDSRHGVIVGGDYMHPENSDNTAAYTSDGGQTWTLSSKFPSGYRSAVALIFESCQPAPRYVAVGSNGIDSSNDGKVWLKERTGEYNAVSFAGNVGWAVGPKGRIERAESLLTPAAGGDLEAVLSDMDRASEKFTTVQADFEWCNYQKVVDETDKQTGRMYFRRSGKNGVNVEIMFAVTSPLAKQVLFKSSRIKLYNSKLDQISEYQAGKNQDDVDAFLNLGFGARGHNLLKSYDIQMLGWETVDGVKTAKLQLTALSPRVRSMFSRFILWIDPRRDVPLGQQVFEPSGDYWISHYTDLKLGEAIPDDRFQIKRTPHSRP